MKALTLVRALDQALAAMDIGKKLSIVEHPVVSSELEAGYQLPPLVNLCTAGVMGRGSF
jgi:hypothetical protein